jgi:hypothetical protein
VASKEIGLEVNADKTKYIGMSGEHHGGRSHGVKTIIIPLRGWKSSNVWQQP